MPACKAAAPSTAAGFPTILPQVIEASESRASHMRSRCVVTCFAFPLCLSFSLLPWGRRFVESKLSTRSGSESFSGGTGTSGEKFRCSPGKVGS